MLLCNNTEFLSMQRSKLAVRRRAAKGAGAMSEVDDLARRFFDLWAEYLAAALSDPDRTEALRGWLAAVAGSLPGILAGEPGGGLSPRPPAGAAAAACAPGERDAAVAELTRRVDELANRVAAFETGRRRRRRPPQGARRRDPAPGS
jgi:hypothetical protein